MPPQKGKNNVRVLEDRNSTTSVVATLMYRNPSSAMHNKETMNRPGADKEGNNASANYKSVKTAKQIFWVSQSKWIQRGFEMRVMMICALRAAPRVGWDREAWMSSRGFRSAIGEIFTQAFDRQRRCLD